ncbi:MAG: family 43 glycosylhydrolase [Oscillospiraceae bacterium]|nr:family 43 glycosylhydrolase [Oscillospiraceae bacterium]
MKKFLSAVCALLVTAACCPAVQSFADNPIVQSVYTSDPAPMVYGDTLYVYTGHDADNADNYIMPDWKCYSTTDMQNWTDYGTILSCDDFAWAEENSAWAAQCVERNGKFYMYVTLVPSSGGGRAIGVAVADSPTGPFKDAIGKPLCGPDWAFIDPTVFIDDDGQAYLYFGNPNPYYVKLNEDMISYSGDIVKVPIDNQSFGTNPAGDGTSYTEGPWFYKRGDLYYLLYAANGIPENIAYSTSPSPTGPWTYRGVIMPTEGRSFTNHCGVVDFQGKSYFSYHNGALEGGSGFDRSVCMEEFSYNSDGTFPTIKMSEKGPSQIKALNPFIRQEAETICWESGIETEPCSAGGRNIANIENGDYVKISGADFGDGAEQFTASIASATNGGKIEIRLDSKDGTLLGTCDVPATDGWQNWKEVSCDIDTVSGEHDIYFVFTGGSGFLFNIDWWQFSGAGSSALSSVSEDGILFRSTFENGSDSWTGRGAASVEMSSQESYQGSKALYISGRTAAWNGTSKKLNASAFVPGKSYSFSVNVLCPECKGTDTFCLKLQYQNAEGETQYASVAQGTAAKGEWIQLSNTEYKIPADASDMYLYVETADSKNSFYIDDAVGAVSGTVIDGAGKGSARTIIRGDVNGDEIINIYDWILARKGLLYGFANSFDEKSADVNQDNIVSTTDLVLLQKYLKGNITEFPQPELPENLWDDYIETASPAMQNFYSDAIYQFGNTSRLWEKIQKARSGEKTTVAYIGGSITEGNHLPTCYAQRSFDYFAETFGTGSNCNFINAGLSGTSSAVGLMRAQRDILNDNPDIIFIEFSVNDHPEEIYKKSYESLVRKCLSQENAPAVVLIINRAKGGYSMQEQMAKIGEYYDLPVISMDNALTNAFNSGLLTTDDYYTDEYHPHAEGCKLISDSIAYFYRQALKSEHKTGAYTIPSGGVYGSEYASGSIIPLADLKNFSSGSFKADNSYPRFAYGFNFEKYSANTPMTFTTEGKGIFIVYKSNQNSSLGVLNVTVNGKTSEIDGNRLYAWGGPEAECAYMQNTSGTLNVSIDMKNAGTDFTIWGIGVMK